MEAVMVSVQMPAPQGRERVRTGLPGIPVLIGGSVVVLLGLVLAVGGARRGGPVGVVLVVAGVVLALAGLRGLVGLTVGAPGKGRVVQVLGCSYSGPLRVAGLRCVNPFTKRVPVSTRIR